MKTPWDDETREYFDGIAAGGGTNGGGINVNKWQVVEPLLAGVPAGGKILECGAGTGMYTLQMLQRGYRITAVDLSSRALESLRRVAVRGGLSDRLKTVQGRFQDVAISLRESFDAVTFFKTLHHFPDLPSIREAIRVGYRVVRPGGVLIGLEPNGECPFWRPGLLARGRDFRSGQSVWLMERNLMLITERNLTSMFRRLPAAEWDWRGEYLIPAFVANRFPALCGPLNRLLSRTPLRRRAFNVTFSVRKGGDGE